VPIQSVSVGVNLEAVLVGPAGCDMQVAVKTTTSTTTRRVQ